MNFDIKAMYRYLLSHTFPGMMLGFLILLYLQLVENIDVYDNLIYIIEKSSFLFIVGAYSISTCLGFIVDGIHHTFYEDLRERSIKKNDATEKYLSITNELKLELYKNCIEDDLWYPYETYANISIVMVLGSPLAIYFLISLSVAPIVVNIILCLLYVLATWIMIHSAKITLDQNLDEEKCFTDAYCEKNIVAQLECDADVIIDDLLNIETQSFPSKWIYDDVEDYYKKNIANRLNIFVTLRYNCKMIGYLLAIPHNEAVKELKDDDPLLVDIPGCFYIESAAILPEHRGGTGFRKLFGKFIKEC